MLPLHDTTVCDVCVIRKKEPCYFNDWLIGYGTFTDNVGDYCSYWWGFHWYCSVTHNKHYFSQYKGSSQLHVLYFFSCATTKPKNVMQRRYITKPLTLLIYFGIILLYSFIHYFCFFSRKLCDFWRLLLNTYESQSISSSSDNAASSSSPTS